MKILKLIFFILPCAASYAINPFVLSDAQTSYILGRHLEYLEDKEKILTIEDVYSGAYRNKFMKSNKDAPNFGASRSAFWIKFALKQNTDIDWLLEMGFPYLDKIDLYYKDFSGKWIRHYIDDSMPFGARKIKYHKHVFELPPVYNEEKIFFMRFEMQGAMIIPLTIWEKRAFYAKDHDQQYVFGLYYGIIIAMFLYNLFLFFFFREKAYLYYIFYALAMGLLIIMDNGLGFEYLWPKYPKFNNISPVLIDFNFFIWIILFSREFLQIKQLSKTLNYIFSGFLLISFIGLFMPLFLSIAAALNAAWIIGFFLILFLVASGFYSMLKGYRPAKYFLLAWGSFFIGVVIVVFRNFGYLESNFFTIYSMQIGSAIEVILLSFALGDRMKLIKEERDKFQLDLAQAKFQALQNRMSPHFLFNTLNAIYAMMHSSKTNINLAKKAVIQLSDTYHFLTDQALKSLISFQEEWIFLTNYLDIMKTRFHDRTQIDIKKTGKFEKTLIPPVTIQPIVENCFKHGLENINKFRIKISAEPIKDGAFIMITDNGKGLKNDNPFLRSLDNIKKRLEYGFLHVNFTIENLEKGGLKVTVIYYNLRS